MPQEREPHAHMQGSWEDSSCGWKPEQTSERGIIPGQIEYMVFSSFWCYQIKSIPY